MPEIAVELATPDRCGVLAGVFGRAFVDEPMLRTSLGAHGDVAARFTSCFASFLERALDLGVVWEAGAGAGAAVWVPPNGFADESEHPWSQPRIHALTDDRGRRYEAFWEWVGSRTPDDGVWHLDSIAVEPSAQRRGIGACLIAAGLARARENRCGVFLSTGTARNVILYERFGFRVVESLEAPDEGARVWFMRWDPQ